MYFVISCGVCGLKQLIYFISVSQLKGTVFRCEVVPLLYVIFQLIYVICVNMKICVKML